MAEHTADPANEAADAPPRSRLMRFWFTVDLRSAGLFRILLGLVLVWHWFDRWRWLDVLYAANGVLPASLLSELRDVPGYRGFFTPLEWLDGSPLAVQAFFLATLFCFVMFLIGYRTRLFGLLSLLALGAIAQRNFYCLISADYVLGSLMLWAQFLPLGKRFSIDALNAALRRGVELPQAPRGEELEPTVPAPRQSGVLVAAFGIVLQIGLIYFFTALWKTVPMLWGEGVAWRNGTAVHYVLHMEQSLLPLAVWVREAPLWVIQLLSYGTLMVEFAALPMLLLPWGQPYLRRIILVPLIGLHAGIAATVDAGLFSYVMFASYAILLTSADWASLKRLLARFSRRATVYYDDSCGVCTFTCKVLAACDRFGRLSFIGSSETSAWRHNIASGLTEKTVVVFDDGTGRQFTRAGAMAAAIRGLPLPFHVFRPMALPGFRWLSNFGYDLFARNRHRVSRLMGLTACGVPQRGGTPGTKKKPGRRQERHTAKESATPTRARRTWSRPLNLVAFVVLIALLFANLCENALLLVVYRDYVRRANIVLSGEDRTKAPPSDFVRWAGKLVHINENYNIIAVYPGAIQRWDMFSPDPPKFDEWYVIDAEREDGVRVDPMTNETPDFITQPSATKRRFERTWAAYLLHALAEYGADRQESVEILREAFCQYVVQAYNRRAEPGQRIQWLDIYHMRRNMPPPDAADSDPVHVWDGKLDPDEGQRVEATITPRRDGWSPFRSAYLLGSYDTTKSPPFESATDPKHPRTLPRLSWYPSGQKRSAARVHLDTGVNLGDCDLWYPNGAHHVGPFDRQGRRHGHWVHHHSGGWPQNEGHWEHGQPHGKWKYYYPDGFVREQAMLADGRKHGEATEYYPGNLPKARGLYRDGARHGSWVYWEPSGSKQMAGEYHQGKRQGEWVFWQSGVLIGRRHFEDDLLEGEWIAYYPDGKVYEKGSMHQGRRHGTWERRHASGKLSETGQYEHGQKTGLWNVSGEAGGRAEETYQAGQLHGPFVEYGEKGVKLQSGQYVEGNREGPWTYWHANKRISRQGNFKNDLQDGTWKVWHENGNRQQEVNFRNGQAHGKWTSWAEDGKTLEVEAEFVNGQQHGQWTFYHPNGKPQRSGRFEKGKASGLWTFFNADGSKSEEGVFVDGQKHGEWKTWVDGKLVLQTYREGVLIDSEKEKSPK